MYFKHEYTVSELKLRDNWGMQFSYNGSHNLTIQFRGPTEEEVLQGHDVETTFIVAQCELAPSLRVCNMFESLARNVLPRGSGKPEGPLTRYIDQAGHISENYVPPLDLMPPPLISFVDQVRHELWDYANRTVRVLRWVRSAGLRHQSLASLSFRWSTDGEAWKPMPSTVSAYLTDYTVGFKVSERLRDYVVELVKQGVDEPLGHELYREAREQASSNPRSALLIGIAAAEVGIKAFIWDRFPDTGWLVENMPSPDIIKILKEYLPKIQTRRPGSPPAIIPEPIINSLRAARDRRNRLTHVGKTAIDPGDLREWMRAISDLLWLLDYYRGYDWAIDHLRTETRDLLGR